MAHVATPGMAVTYIRTTSEHFSATIIGPSTRGDDFFHVKYMRNGHVFEGKLYFTKDIVDDSFVPRNRKPQPIPKGCPKGQACAIVQDEAQGGKGLLFHSS